jgi:hypothetical protein
VNEPLKQLIAKDAIIDVINSTENSSKWLIDRFRFNVKFVEISSSRRKSPDTLRCQS